LQKLTKEERNVLQTSLKKLTIEELTAISKEKPSEIKYVNDRKDWQELAQQHDDLKFALTKLKLSDRVKVTLQKEFKRILKTINLLEKKLASEGWWEK
jgi:hypothetical protein